MNPERTIPALIFIMICFLIIAGCIFHPATENRTNNASVNGSTVPLVLTPVQTQCPVPVKTNRSVWLTMNPITDHRLGDIFEVNGTIQQKNRTEKNAVKIYVNMECYIPDYHVFWPKGIATQYPSECEVKTWSYQVNLSKDSPAGECEFEVSAYTKERDATELDGHHRSVRFNVTPLNSDISVGSERV